MSNQQFYVSNLILFSTIFCGDQFIFSFLFLIAEFRSVAAHRSAVDRQLRLYNWGRDHETHLGRKLFSAIFHSSLHHMRESITRIEIQSSLEILECLEGQFKPSVLYYNTQQNEASMP